MKTPLPALAVTAAALSGLGGCATLVNEQASGYQSAVNPVMTEHSLALSCLGGLIGAGVSMHAPLLRQLRACGLERLDHGELLGRHALAHQTAQDGAAHVAAADEGDTWMGGERCGHGMLSF